MKPGNMVSFWKHLFNILLEPIQHSVRDDDIALYFGKSLASDLLYCSVSVIGEDET